MNVYSEPGVGWATNRNGRPLDVQSVIGVVELGNEWVTAVMVRRRSARGAEVLGMGRIPTEGFLLGQILDPHRLAETMRQALEQASLGMDGPLPPIFLGTDGSSIVRSREAIPARRALRLRRVWNELARRGGPEGLVLIHMMRREATHETATFDLAWLPETELEELRSAATLAGCELAGVLWRPAGVGHGLMVDAALQHGAVVLDIGAYTTTATTYYRGWPVAVKRMLFGGHHQTDAVCKIYGAGEEVSECLKTEFGSLVTGDGRNFGPFVENCYECDRPYQSREEMIAALRCLTESRLEKLRDEWAEDLPAGVPVQEVVLTGGASRLAGTDELVASIFGRPCRPCGAPVAWGLGQEPEPGTAAAMGLAAMVLEHSPDREGGSRARAPVGLLRISLQALAVVLQIVGWSR